MGEVIHRGMAYSGMTCGAMTYRVMAYRGMIYRAMIYRGMNYRATVALGHPDRGQRVIQLWAEPLSSVSQDFFQVT